MPFKPPSAFQFPKNEMERLLLILGLNREYLSISEQLDSIIAAIGRIDFEDSFWARSKCCHLALQRVLDRCIAADDADQIKLTARTLLIALSTKTVSPSVRDLYKIVRDYQLKALVAMQHRMDPTSVLHECQVIALDLIDSGLVFDHGRLNTVMGVMDTLDVQGRGHAAQLETFKKCLERGYAPSLPIYHSHMNRVIESVDVPVAKVELLKNWIGLMRIQGTAPSAKTMSYLFRAIELKRAKIPLAEMVDVEAQMLTMGIPHSQESAAALVLTLAKNYYYEDSFQRLKDMQLSGMERPLPLFNRLIHYCSRGERASTFCIHDLYFTLKREYCPDNDTFNGMLACCLKAKDLIGALSISSEMTTFDSASLKLLGDISDLGETEYKNQIANIVQGIDKSPVPGKFNMI